MQLCKECRDGSAEEVEILEKDQCADVSDDAGKQQRAPKTRSGCRRNPMRGQKVDGGNPKEQENKLRIPEGVEVITGEQYAQHSEAAAFGDGPVNEEDDGQEEPVLAGCE